MRMYKLNGLKQSTRKNHKMMEVDVDQSWNTFFAAAPAGDVPIEKELKSKKEKKHNS